MHEKNLIKSVWNNFSNSWFTYICLFILTFILVIGFFKMEFGWF